MDVDSNLLDEQLKALKTFFPSVSLSLMLCLNIWLLTIDLQHFLMFFAVRIYLTTPVAVASVERSFSKLKLIKTYLRSIISQERQNNLAMLFIENDIAKPITLKML